jgi:hypothetical protein
VRFKIKKLKIKLLKLKWVKKDGFSSAADIERKRGWHIGGFVDAAKLFQTEACCYCGPASPVPTRKSQLGTF